MSWVVWLIIWLILFVGTGVGGYLLGRRLWRQIKVIMSEAERSLALVEKFDTALTSAEGRAGAYTGVAHLAATPDQRRAWKQVRFQNAVAQRVRRNDRRERTLARWREIATFV